MWLCSETLEILVWGASWFLSLFYFLLLLFICTSCTYLSLWINNSSSYLTQFTLPGKTKHDLICILWKAYIPKKKTIIKNKTSSICNLYKGRAGLTNSGTRSGLRDKWIRFIFTTGSQIYFLFFQHLDLLIL